MNPKRLSGWAGLALVAVFGAPEARGDLLVLTAEGVVTEIDDQGGVLDPSITVGAAFSMSVEYDPDLATDLNSDPQIGQYVLDAPIAGQIGDVVFASEDPPVAWVVDQPAGDAFRVSADDGVGLAFTYCRLRLTGGPDVFDSDALPSTIDIADFPTRTFSISDVPPEKLDGPYYTIDAEVTSLTIIPEPGTLALVALGGTFLIKRRRWAE